VSAEPAVAGLLLAAGAGRRMGGPKALVELDGEPLVRRGIRLLVDSGCAPVVVVVGASADRVRGLCDGAQVVEAADWATGMGASLRAGLTALAGAEPVPDACVVALVDQPRVTVEAVRRLRAAHTDGAAVAVASYGGRSRNPGPARPGELGRRRGGGAGRRGARPWLRAHPDQVVAVDCSDTGAPDDVDTPEELAALVREHASAGPRSQTSPARRREAAR
jgi:nicotine blue oxidoreductase